jgi:hypothetical protein
LADPKVQISFVTLRICINILECTEVRNLPL